MTVDLVFAKKEPVTPPLIDLVYRPTNPAAVTLIDEALRRSRQ